MAPPSDSSTPPSSGTASGGLPKNYAPSETEPLIRQKWREASAFAADPVRVTDGQADPYCILIPPPNVTAPLHLGHALNNTLQDVLARTHRMRGLETLWMPGTDHAGIATQAVVERRLLIEEGKRRTDFERDEFVARVQAWKDEYEATIVSQLELLGCSCDWDRRRFTMDPVCAASVREAFFRLFQDDLIYRGKRLVNWDPVLGTAVADDELEDKVLDSFFWYLRYPVVEQRESGEITPVTWSDLQARGYPEAASRPAAEPASITVATTRPETYMGDTAVAVNPDDPRAESLRGLRVQLPLVGRILPIIEDDYVVLPDPDSDDTKARFASGFLKVTPAHDTNDYDIGRRHEERIQTECSAGEVMINIMAPDASISDRHGWNDVGDASIFVGLSRDDARTKVVEEFESRGLLEQTRPYSHAVKHSDRSKAPIEPYLSDQWYCRVSSDRLRGEAQRALAPEQRSTDTFPIREGDRSDGQLRFFPDRYAKTYESWHDNLRDWCISRQLWWGHRIPVWHLQLELGSNGEGPDPALADLLTATSPGLVIRIVRAESGDPVDAEDLLSPRLLTPGLYDFYACALTDADASSAGLEEMGFQQDPDVLDTWFSSALWPISTMGWPRPEDFPQEELNGLLQAFNPSTVLCTGRDIITLWVSRMVMFNRYFRDGDLPFKDVYINPMVQDGYGQRMSKTLGNGVDPRDILETHGADAARFVLCQIATSTQDVRMPVDMLCPHTGERFKPVTIETEKGYTVAAPEQTCPSDPKKKMVTAYGVVSGKATPSDETPLAGNTSSKFDAGRNLCNKLWNASRFADRMLDGTTIASADEIQPESLSLIDRWMLGQLAEAGTRINESVEAYHFADFANTAYDLLWNQFCDWYLEGVKPTVASDPCQAAVLRASLDVVLRLLHPLMPFITEAVNEHLQKLSPASIPGVNDGSAPILAQSAWPEIDEEWIDERVQQRFARVQSFIGQIREVRSQHRVDDRRQVVVHITQELRDDFGDDLMLVMNIARVRDLRDVSDAPESGAGVNFRFEGAELMLSDLADAVDESAERERLERLIADLDKSIGALNGRLNNKGYTDKAPAHLVQQTRDQLATAEAEREALRASLQGLSG